MNNQRLSVLIPCYNSEKTIVRCLNSIKCKIHHAQVIINIVNDGSTDHSSQLILEYIKNNNLNNINLVNQENKGLAKTREILIKSVATDYFLFMDADDYFTDDAVECFLNSIETNRDYYLFKTMKKVKLNKFVDYYLSHSSHNNALDLVNNNFFPFWNTVFKTNFINVLKPKFCYANCEDYGVVDYLLVSSNDFECVDQYTYIYDNTSSTISKAKISVETFLNNMYNQMQNLLAQIKTKTQINNDYSCKINLWYSYIFMWVLKTHFFSFNLLKLIRWTFTHRYSKIHELFNIYSKPKVKLLLILRFFMMGNRKIK